jgi:1-acyl-sn-glycerol-3-phosphate acyltransferase
MLPGLTAAVLIRKQRSFRGDALTAVGMLEHPLEIQGLENVPASGPYLLTINHYNRPGFGGSWWLTFALSAALPVEVYWVMTGAWIFPGKFYEAPMRILSTWLFRRIAAVYGFTNMTPIEPYSSDVQGRARAVRRVLEYARSSPNAVIGLAPEGQDMPVGVLGMPPPGLGRFVALLAPLCQVILPAGVYEDGERLCVRFGEPYRLEISTGLTNDQLDAVASQVVMRAIAKLLPERLRGTYKD